jgi:hypothetical protein
MTVVLKGRREREKIKAGTGGAPSGHGSGSRVDGY